MRHFTTVFALLSCLYAIDASACRARIIDGEVQPTRCFPFLYISGVATVALEEAGFMGVWFAYAFEKDDAFEPVNLGLSFSNPEPEQVIDELMKQIQSRIAGDQNGEVVAALAYAQHRLMGEKCRLVPVTAIYRQSQEQVLFSMFNNSTARISRIAPESLAQGCTPQ